MYPVPNHEGLETHTTRQLNEASKVTLKYAGNGKFELYKNHFGKSGGIISYREAVNYLESSHPTLLVSERMTFMDCNFKISGIHTKLIERDWNVSLFFCQKCIKMLYYASILGKIGFS